MKTMRLAGVVITSDDKFIYDIYEIDYITAKQVHDFLEKANGEEVTIKLNSPGGSVYEGLEIYTLLKDYAGKVTVNVTGLAASIASVIMLGGDIVNISNGAQVMIHNPSTIAIGDKEDLERGINSLAVTERTIAGLYASKASKSQEEFQSLMKKETWFTAKEALEIGLVDNVTHLPVDDDLKLVDSYSETMVALADFKQFAKLNSEDIMSKSLIDKLKGALKEAGDITNQSDAEKADEIEETETEEVETESTEAEMEEDTKTEETSEEASKTVEDVENVNEQLVTSLEKATQKIEELTSENEKLKTELSDKDNTINSLQASNAKLEQNITKATNVINKFNALLDSESEQTVAVVQTSEHENSQGAFVGRFKHKQD